MGLKEEAIHELCTLDSDQAVKMLISAYPFLSGSELLSHEALFALGQFSSDKAPILKDFVISVVNDEKDNNLSRHEAAEALANYFLPELHDLYTRHIHSPCKELKWTCEIALEKIKNPQLKGRYGRDFNSTKEPAAPFNMGEFRSFLS